MGVERAVTRWYAQRQSLWNEISALEAQIEQIGQIAQSQEQGQELQQPPVASDDLARQLAGAQEKLRHLGPCPKVMMG